MTEATYSSCRCPPSTHPCPHRAALSNPTDHRRNRRSADTLLAMLTIFCSPAVVYVKTGMQDFWLNLILFLFGFVPGWLHAWYILLQHPGCHRCDRTGHHTISYHTQHHEAAIPNAVAQSMQQQQQQQHPHPERPTLEMPSRHSHQDTPQPAQSQVSALSSPTPARAPLATDTLHSGGPWDGVQSPVSEVSSHGGGKPGAMPPQVLLRDGYGSHGGGRDVEAEKRDAELPKYAV